LRRCQPAVWCPVQAGTWAQGSGSGTSLPQISTDTTTHRKQKKENAVACQVASYCMIEWPGHKRGEEAMQCNAVATTGDWIGLRGAWARARDIRTQSRRRRMEQAGRGEVIASALASASPTTMIVVTRGDSDIQVSLILLKLPFHSTFTTTHTRIVLRALRFPSPNAHRTPSRAAIHVATRLIKTIKPGRTRRVEPI
jgi:hypothetical protein